LADDMFMSMEKMTTWEYQSRVIAKLPGVDNEFQD
jgi:hypothetical protein